MSNQVINPFALRQAQDERKSKSLLDQVTWMNLNLRNL